MNWISLLAYFWRFFLHFVLYFFSVFFFSFFFLSRGKPLIDLVRNCLESKTSHVYHFHWFSSLVHWNDAILTSIHIKCVCIGPYVGLLTVFISDTWHMEYAYSEAESYHFTSQTVYPCISVNDFPFSDLRSDFFFWGGCFFFLFFSRNFHPFSLSFSLLKNTWITLFV